MVPLARESLRQCEQAPQVANSMLVGEWDNSLAQARDGRSGWMDDDDDDDDDDINGY